MSEGPKPSGDAAAYTPPPVTGAEGLLLRAALLAGHGAGARPLARRMTEALRDEGGRSCFEAGSSLQWLVEAPGGAELGVGLRLGRRPPPERLQGLVSTRVQQAMGRMHQALPRAGHISLGSWLFWQPHRQAISYDLRDADPAAATQRLRQALDSEHRALLQAIAPQPSVARPWALSIEQQDAGNDDPRLRVHWLLHRGVDPRPCLSQLNDAAWPAMMEVLGGLLRHPGRSGRWMISRPLDHISPNPGASDMDPAVASDTDELRISNTAWLLVPEDEAKQRAIGRLMERLEGPRAYAEALWSLGRNGAPGRWRVGRTCEIHLNRHGLIRTRLYYSPYLPATRK